VENQLNKDKSQISDYCLVITLVSRIQPVFIELAFLQGVHFEHRAIQNANCEFSHFFRTALEEVFFEDFFITEFKKDPSGAVKVFVDATFEQV